MRCRRGAARAGSRSSSLCVQVIMSCTAHDEPERHMACNALSSWQQPCAGESWRKLRSLCCMSPCVMKTYSLSACRDSRAHLASLGHGNRRRSMLRRRQPARHRWPSLTLRRRQPQHQPYQPTSPRKSNWWSRNEVGRQSSPEPSCNTTFTYADKRRL